TCALPIYCKERLNPMFAGGIFPSQEFVFAHGREQRVVIFETATHCGGEFGDLEGTAVSFGCDGGFENDAAIRGDCAFILLASAGLLGLTQESFALRLSPVVLVFSPRL